MVSAKGEAVLGGEVVVNTLGGQVKIAVKPGTHPNARLRLKGNQFGDLYVTLKVHLPEHLSPKEKELFTELSKIRK